MKLPLYYCLIGTLPLSVNLAIMGIFQCVSAASHMSQSQSSISAAVEDGTEPKQEVVTAKDTGVSNNHQINKKKNITRNLQSINHRPGSATEEWVQLGQIIEEYGRVAMSKDSSMIVIGGTKFAWAFRFNNQSEEWVQVGETIKGYWRLSVDINDAGDVIIIGDGETSNDKGDLWAGHVRIFQLINDQWVQKGQDLYGQNSDRFGHDVAISGKGSRVIIVAPFDRSQAGSARVYEYDEIMQQWEQLGNDILGERVGDWYYEHQSVDMNNAGDVVIHGAESNFDNGNDAGHARIFQLINNQWAQKGQDLDGREEYDSFGKYVAISGTGNQVIIGALEYIQVYEYNGITQKWRQLGDDFLGMAVDINDTGDTIITKVHDGHARVYQRTNGQWVQKGQEFDTQAGAVAAISGEGHHVIIGETETGHVKVYAYPHSSSCDDSPLKIFMPINIFIRKSKSAKSCKFISENANKYCKFKKYQAHCPRSCGVCETFGSSDSIGIFVFQSKIRNCKWLRGSSISQIVTECQKDKIRATCRQTCGDVTPHSE